MKEGPSDQAASETIKQIVTSHLTYWKALEAAMREDATLSGQTVEWGRLDIATNVDKQSIESKKGTVNRHPPTLNQRQ